MVKKKQPQGYCRRTTFQQQLVQNINGFPIKQPKYELINSKTTNIAEILHVPDKEAEPTKITFAPEQKPNKFAKLKMSAALSMYRQKLRTFIPIK